MANDGQIVYQVDIDTKNAKVDLQALTKDIQKETGKWESAGKQSSSGIESSFTGMLKKLTAGFSAVKIGKALLDLGKDALQAASDLQEVQNVVDVTFGTNAGKIETWAKNAGTQFGLTETQAKKFSSTMGAMLKSSGLAGDQIVDVSTDLAGLAADMASFYNLDFDEAFSKIRSGMSGMTMPLKELGIDMSVDTMNAFALAQGLDKTFNQMTQAEQTMLRYQYLMQTTADAQGDFARTSDGYANALRQLETNLTTLKTNLGNVLLDVVNPLINGINELFADRSGSKTVLDDFADIDADTERKLAQVKQTATDARELAEQLDRIGGEKASKAGGNLQQMVDGLTGINLDQSKSGIVTDFLSVMSSNIDVLSSIQGTDAEGAKAWLDGIAESANKLDADDAQGWTDLLNVIKEGLPGFENTEFGNLFFGALGGSFSDVEQQASVLSWAVETLGGKTDKTAQEQAVWLETCKRLVKTIPGLSSIINTETGEIKGGTQAVKDYIKAWEEGQEKLILLGALEQKESALSSRFADLPGLQLDMALAEKRLRDHRAKMDAILDKYKISKDNLDYSMTFTVEDADAYRMSNDDWKAYNDLATAQADLESAATDATNAYNKQAQALEEAKVALEEYRETIDEMGGDVEAVQDATAKFYEDNAENIKTLAEAANDALKSLTDYVQGVHDAVESSINSTVKGFEKITTKQDKVVSDLTKKLEGMGDRTAKNKKEWDELSKSIDDAQGKTSTTSAQGMAANLAQQAEYMTKYLEYLNMARENGIDSEILAQLSDGSVESYDYLAALAKASPTEVEEINKNWQTVIDKKKELTDELTNTQLEVDQTYDNLSKKAQEAVAALDQATPAEENAAKTVQSVAVGIRKYIPDVADAVDGVLSELARLSGYNVHVDFGGFGEIDFTTETGKKADGSGRFGVDFVPHDDYLIRAHEGERLLTAQENQIWNTLLNGGYAGFDLESLGGVMRDNIKPGGNVYLDGKAVGTVISDRQGRSYKSLQRSGWQS
jgi:hypothetical protein